MNLTKPRPGIELNRRVKVVKVNGDRVTVIEIDGVKYSFFEGWEREMSEIDKEALIVSLCFLSGKEEWWYADKDVEWLIAEYDRLNAIYK